MARFAFLWAGVACCVGYAQPSTPVILISVDTLRADHLSCYQPSRRPTPHIDGLAKNGTLFSQVSTPFPLTLPAHTALLTSTYPFTNGVEDNGIPLDSKVATLATILKGAGYRTAAFVGSFVLDRRFGLNRGFDVYDGPIDLHDRTMAVPMERKRSGAQVVEAATHWLEHNSGSAPVFLFLHLYDLHLPYDHPGEVGYSAELAYEDRVLGEFFATLERRGLFQKALVVFTSDHGEGLGDHGESTHGYFIYQSTLHVPLIMHWPAGFKRVPQARVDEPASLLDVAPTILDAVGVARPAEMRGRTLLGPNEPREIYSESVYARRHFGCAGLQSLRAGQFKYIESPKPELYDLSTDPGETKNLFDQQRSKAASMRTQMATVRGGTPSTVAGKSPSAETSAKLRSLGYLSGSGKSLGPEPRVDPKDRISDFEHYVSALTLASAGKLGESDAVLQSLADKLPDVPEIRFSLGSNQQRQGEWARAAREFRRVVEQSPSDAQAHFELGFCHFQLAESHDALQEFKATLALEPWYTRADEALAELYIQKKDLAQARAHLNHLLSVDPNSYTAQFNLGIMAAMEQNWTEAQKRMLLAIRLNPASAEAHDTLGKIYFQRGELDQARQQFEETVRLEPKSAAGHYDLAMVLQKQGKPEEAAREMRAAQAADTK